MAYTTNSVIGAQGVLSALETFMLANGWTLHDPVSLYDRVYFSDGTDSTQHMYIRVTQDLRTLNFDAQSADFTVGQVVTGATSGHTGLIAAITDGGATGSLSLINTTGMFVDNESVTDPLGGSATVNGRLTFPADNRPDVSALENALDWLNVRHYTYWNSTTHIGVNEVARVGPFLGFVQNQLQGITAINEIGFRTAQINQPQIAFRMFDKQLDTSYGEMNLGSSYSHPMTRHTGYGTIVGNPYDGQSTFYDGVAMPATTSCTRFQSLAFNSFRDYDTGEAGVANGNKSAYSLPFYDKASDKVKLFSYRSSSNVSTYFVIVDLENQSYIYTPPPPGFSSSQSNNSCPIWDGADYIYVLHGLTTAFARYSISTNTWTALQPLPAPQSADGISYMSRFGINAIFIPRGTIPGVNNDEIWFPGTSTIVRRYTIDYAGLGSFTSLSLPATSSNDSFFNWDGERYVYVRLAWSSQFAYVLDLQNISSGWKGISLESTTSVGLRGERSAFMVDQYACRIRVSPTGVTQYRFIGDKDGIIAQTTISGHNWFAGFSKFDSLRPQNIANLTAATSPGASVTVTVDSSVGFETGDRVNIVDRATGIVTPTTLSGVPSATQLSFPLGVSIGATSYITIDGINCALWSDSYFAVTSMGVDGVEPDGMPNIYRLVPTVSEQDILITTQDPAARRQLWPIEMRSFSDTKLKSYGRRGRIPGLYVVAGTDGDIVRDANGDQYLVLTSESMRLFTNRARTKLAIGPIN